MSIDPVLLQQIINGLSLGAMYALLALGFTLVYGILELINFAHFNVFMVSSFIGMWALELLGLSGQSTVLGGFELVGALGFAFIVTMLSAGVLGVIIERIALRPLRNVRDAIQTSKTKTLQGVVSFDDNGDITNREVSVFQIKRDDKHPLDSVLHQYKYLGVAPQSS